MEIRPLYRMLSAMLSAVLLLQPVLLAADAATDAAQGAAVKGMVEKLKSGKVFEGSPTAADDVERWGGILATYDAYLPLLERQEQGDRALCERWARQIESWATALAKKTPVPAAAPIVAVEKQLRENLAQVLAKRRVSADYVLQEVARARGFLDDFKRQGKLDWRLLGAMAKIEAQLHAQNDYHNLSQGFWGLFRLVQFQLAATSGFSPEEQQALSKDLEALDQSLTQESESFARAYGGVLRIGRLFTAPVREVDMVQEGKILRATATLVDAVSAELEGRSDANGKAHHEYLKRVQRILADRVGAYEELTGAPLEDVSVGSFLDQPAEGIGGQWGRFAARHKAISLDLVSRLKDKDAALADLAKAVPALTDAVLKGVEEIDLGKIGLGKENERLLRQVRQDFYASADSVKSLNGAREAVRAALIKAGKKPFEGVDLTDPREAARYDELGIVYEMAQDTAETLDRTAALLLSAFELAKDPKTVALVKEGQAAHQAVRQSAEKLAGLAAQDQKAFDSLRDLSIEMAQAYAEQGGKFAKDLSAAAQGAAGTYDATLKAMAESFGREARKLDALGAGLQTLPPKVALTARWSGASGLGRSVARGIQRAAYWENQAADALKRLARADGSAPADNLALLDLALATGYPVRLFVAESGIQLAIGSGDQAVRVTGIGNVDQVKMAAAGMPADFTLQGATMGWTWSGAWDGFKGAVGAAANAVVETGKFVYDVGAKFVENIVTDPLKWIEYGIYAGVGIAVLTGAIATAPAWLLPAVGVAVVSDLLGAVVDVSAARKWISDGAAALIKLGIGIAGMVVGGMLDKGLRGIKGAWEVLRGLPQEFVEGLRLLGPRIKDLIKNGIKVAEELKQLKDFLSSLGPVQTIVGTIKDTWNWLTGGGDQPGGQQGPGGQTPGTGLPPPSGPGTSSGKKVPQLDPFW